MRIGFSPVSVQLRKSDCVGSHAAALAAAAAGVASLVMDFKDTAYPLFESDTLFLDVSLSLFLVV